MEITSWYILYVPMVLRGNLSCFLNIIVRGRLYIFVKKVSFNFAIALFSIGSPDIPKNFAQRSEMENMVF